MILNKIRLIDNGYNFRVIDIFGNIKDVDKNCKYCSGVVWS